MELRWACNLWVIGVIVGVTRGQEPAVQLAQGPLLGVKIFPESSRVPIDAFMGVPYAASPTGRLRFAAPEKHKGWKGTLLAQEMGPPCLQPETRRPREDASPGQSLLGRLPSSRRASEDCLYLNIWTPDSGERRNGGLPVLLSLVGEGWSRGSPAPLPGQDLAGEGLVVVTAASRLGPLGFLCLGASDARGNLGLLDQYFALLWLRENIAKFGGDPDAVTILGHTTGAAAVLYHMVSPRTKTLFSRVILMSSSALPRGPTEAVTRSSRLAASFLGCLFESAKEMVFCLREKSSEDIMKAFKAQYQSGNWTDTMFPVVDTFLETNDQYIPIDPLKALSGGNFHQLPVLTGLTSLEATDSREHWEDLARQGYHQLRHYVDFTAIPSLMGQYGLSGGPNAALLKELVRWQYAGRAVEGDAWGLLRQLRALYSEAQHEAPHARLLQLLVQSPQPLYVYRYQQAGGVDLYGKQSNSSGAGHGSELPYLFGPTLFQQLTRRRLNVQEERLSKRLRIMWAEFVKFGFPTPARQYDAWRPYTLRDPHVQTIGEEEGGGGAAARDGSCQRAASFWNQLLPKLANVSMDREARSVINDKRTGHDGNETLRHAMYSLLGLVLALAVLLVVCVVLLKRSSKERQLGRDFGSF